MTVSIVLLASAAVALCESCHGPGGNSTTPGTPSIAAQPDNFLETQLVYFREGLRNAPVMQAVAKDMKDEDITSLARHFSAQKATVHSTQADKALAERGLGLARSMHCGQCPVLVEGQPVRSWVTPASSVAGKKIVTIEGLGPKGLNVVQKAWVEKSVPQCGYCQSGMIMAATALLGKTPKPTDEQIDTAMTNLCRCGTYARVRDAIHAAAKGKA